MDARNLASSIKVYMKLSDNRIWDIAEEVLEYVPTQDGFHHHLTNHYGVVKAIKKALEEAQQAEQLGLDEGTG